ncbi:MAG TPA: signal peptidase II [Candidatus Glassbacteria bacterium]|nr:signal peptidase II [Candidatus Glassbacteria bacterium]
MKRGSYLWISLAVLLLDQLTKLAVVAKFSHDSTISIIPGLFRLVRVENRGIAFGMFSDSPSPLTSIIMVLISVAAIGLVGVLLWQNPPSAARSGAGLALILGGAAGNLIDRLARGHVVDFLDFYLGSYHWPAFNIADSAISIGAATLLWDLLVAQPARHRAA